MRLTECSLQTGSEHERGEGEGLKILSPSLSQQPCSESAQVQMRIPTGYTIKIR
jgi:hypothetical protein